MTFALLQKNMNCFPAVNYMFKVNNRNTRSEICLKLTIKIPERRLPILYPLKTPENLSKRTQTSLRRLQDFLKRLRRLTTKQEVIMTSGKRRRIYDVLKTSDLRRLEDVQFTTSWRRLIYDVLRTAGFRRFEDVRFASSWRRPIYDVFKTSVKRRLCSNVVVTSIQRQKKLFFLILYCLKYSENFKFSSLG